MESQGLPRRCSSYLLRLYRDLTKVCGRQVSSNSRSKIEDKAFLRMGPCPLGDP